MTLHKYFTSGLVTDPQTIPICPDCKRQMQFVHAIGSVTYTFECSECITRRVNSVPSELREICAQFAELNGIPYEVAVTSMLAAMKKEKK